MTQVRTPFGPEALRATLREDFVGNECGSEEYRETQPAKGLRYYAHLIELLQEREVPSGKLPPLNRDQLDADLNAELRRAVSLGAAWHQVLMSDPPYPGWVARDGDTNPWNLGWPWYAGCDALRPLLEMYFAGPRLNHPSTRRLR